MVITNITRRTIIAKQADAAETFLSRLVGLIGRKELKSGQALIIKSCQSIHMFFMQFPIDAVFVGKDHEVVGLVRGIRPFGLSKVFWKADFVIELPLGAIDVSGTYLGDKIEIK